MGGRGRRKKENEKRRLGMKRSQKRRGKGGGEREKMRKRLEKKRSQNGGGRVEKTAI